jgi:tetratricopeptide (TPR) repeat protein
MELEVKNRSTRWLLVVLGIVFFVAASVWIARAYLASELAENISLKNLELAVKLDPHDAEYQLKLGRLYEYSMTEVQPQQALAHLRRATELSPYDPEGWLELGGALEFQGRIPEAEACLRRADSLAPHIPAYQWPLANFFLLQGNIDEAFRHFRVVLAGTSQYDQIVFRTAWKASDNAEMILNELIPPSIPTEFSYLDYLLAQQRLTEAQAVWKRIVSGSEKFNPQQSSAYIDALINNHRPEEAYEAWSDLGRKGLVQSALPRSDNDLVTNGDFEDEMVNMGFGWRVVSIEGVYAGLDSTTYHSPNHALLVQFSGKQNLDYAQVVQYVKVPPARSYRFRAFMKTEGITTDSGPRLEVVDPYNQAAVDVLTENMTGNSETWISVGVDFKTGPQTGLLMVRLRRLPSQKLDNQISGRVWLDDVRLTPLSH